MSCTGKPKFDSEASAQKALKSTVPGITTIHHCHACSKWHFGPAPEPARPARRVRKAAHYARR